MRAVISAAILLLLCIALVIANAIIAGNLLDKMTKLSDDVNNSLADPHQLQTLWKENYFLFSLSIESDELERMNELIESLISAYESNDSSQISKYCRLISDMCDELASFEGISLKSIL